MIVRLFLFRFLNGTAVFRPLTELKLAASWTSGSKSQDQRAGHQIFNNSFILGVLPFPFHTIMCDGLFLAEDVTVDICVVSNERVSQATKLSQINLF